MSVEMDQFKDLYVQTALEHLQELSDVLLKLEADHSQLDLVEQLMRAGHSLKGESAAMGFDQMATLGHVIEDLFTGIGNGGLEITDELANVLFEAFDHLKESVESVSANGAELSCEEYITKIKTLTGLKTEGFGKSSEAEAAAAAKAAQEAPPAAAAPSVQAPIIAPVPPVAEVQVIPAVPNSAAVETASPNVATSLSFDPAKLLHSSITSPEPAAPASAQPALVVAPAKLEDLAIPVADSNGQAGIAAQGVAVNSAQNKEAPVVAPAKLEDIPMPTPQVGGPVAVAAMAASALTAPQVAAATADLVKKPVAAASNQISSVTIKVDKLDQMIGVSEELVLLKMKLKTNTLVQGDTALKAEIHRLDRLVTDLQFYVMQTRLFPISMALHTIPRLVRDVAKKTNKKVRLELVGEDTTVDRTIIDHLTEPFVHLVRNAIDHGIEDPAMRLAIGKEEVAVVKMTSYTKENKFYIEVSDDGAGIIWEKLTAAAIKKGVISAEAAAALTSDAERAKLLFMDGVSTNEEITDISGRGVGMSAVQAAIKKLAGSITVNTEVGKGTTFVIRLPMTLAIMQSLLVGVGDQVFALPANEVSRTILVTLDQLRSSANSQVIVVDEQEVFLHDLAETFKITTDREKLETRTVVLVRQNDSLIGCIVDKIISEDEILVKPLGPLLKHSQHFSGSTILADGRAAPIINIEGLTWSR